MSSIMRRRSGLMGAWLMGAPGLEVRFANPSILKPGRFLSHPLPQETRAPPAPACLRLARSAFVLWPRAEVAQPKPLPAAAQHSFLPKFGSIWRPKRSELQKAITVKNHLQGEPGRVLTLYTVPTTDDREPWSNPNAKRQK